MADLSLLEKEILLRVDQVAGILNCSKRHVYNLLAAGDLELRKTGEVKGYRIPTDSVRKYLERRENEQN